MICFWLIQKGGGEKILSCSLCYKSYVHFSRIYNPSVFNAVYSKYAFLGLKPQATVLCLLTLE